MAVVVPKTVAQYVASLPPEKRKVVAAVRRVLRANLPKGYVETLSWGMISYEIPLNRYPDTYNGKPLCFAGLASTKSGYSLYLTSIYQDPKLLAWFQKAFAKAGLTLDMGKSCVRFKQLEDLPLDAIGEVIAMVPVDSFLAQYESVKKK